MGLDFLFVFLAYVTLCLTAQFAFGTGMSNKEEKKKKKKKKERNEILIKNK